MIINKVIKSQITKCMILVTYLMNNHIKAEKTIEKHGHKSSVFEEKAVFDSYDTSYTISVEVKSEVTTNKVAVNKTVDDIKIVYSKGISISNEVPQVTEETEQFVEDDGLFENTNVDNNYSVIENKNGDQEVDIKIKEKDQVLIIDDGNTKIINSATEDDSTEEESSKENKLKIGVKTSSNLDESSEKYRLNNRSNSENTFDIDTSGIEISGRRRMMNSDVVSNNEETKAEYSNKIIVPHYHSILTRNGIIYEPRVATISTNYDIIKNRNNPSSIEANTQINQKAIQSINNDNYKTTPEQRLLDEYITNNSENQYPLEIPYTQKPVDIPQQTRYQPSNNFNTVLFKKLVEASEHPKNNAVKSYNLENTPKYPNVYWSSNPNTNKYIVYGNT